MNPEEKKKDVLLGELELSENDLRGQCLRVEWDTAEGHKFIRKMMNQAHKAIGLQAMVKQAEDALELSVAKTFNSDLECTRLKSQIQTLTEENEKLRDQIAELESDVDQMKDGFY